MPPTIDRSPPAGTQVSPRRARGLPLRAWATAAVAVAALLQGGCVSAGGNAPATAQLGTPPPADYPGLLVRLEQGDVSELDGLRAGWLAQPDARARLERLDELERQTLQMFDQPLRMGAMGAAILTVYPASLLGNMASAAYYERVSAPELAQRYRVRAEAIAKRMAANGTGTPEAPIPALSVSEAQAYLRYTGITALGALYAAPRSGGLHVSIIGSRTKDKPLATTVFDVTDTYLASSDAARSAPDESARVSSLQRYLGERLREGDSAAQTFVAMNLLAGEAQHRGSAVQLLQQAVSDGNLYARLALVQTMLSEYADTPQEQRRPLLDAAARELEQAAGAGSESALLELGRLQVSDLLGEDGAAERKAQGVANIRRSAEMGHVPAMMVLAGLYAEGFPALPKDIAQAQVWLAKAGEAGDTGARIAYARYQLGQTPATLDERGRAWLLALSDAGNTDAMYTVGALYARGEHIARDLPRARQLFQALAAKAAGDPEAVNNVAWTFAVTDVPELRDARSALQLMSKLMGGNETAARNPAYLDTWAATFAANGRFERAIELQKQAIDAAEAQRAAGAATQSVSDDATLQQLRQHLEAFQRGETITEKVP